MAHTYLDKLNEEINNTPPLVTAAEKSAEMDLFQVFNNTVNNGVDAEKIKKFTYLICLLAKHLSFDILQQQMELIMFLGFKYQFDFSDYTIDQLVKEIKEANDNNYVFDCKLIHTIKF
ncbi:MAG TPA: hypothetical protein VLG50_06580 [Candidatus Saccharimonadales bacterium]|nr:hypothetical protein [Candidatus Saccharimonadales bacterium]